MKKKKLSIHERGSGGARELQNPCGNHRIVIFTAAGEVRCGATLRTEWRLKPTLSYALSAR